jgi:hypothetical protein
VLSGQPWLPFQPSGHFGTVIPNGGWWYSNNASLQLEGFQDNDPTSTMAPYTCQYGKQTLRAHKFCINTFTADPEAHFYKVLMNARVYQNNIVAANYTAVTNMMSCMKLCT